MAGPPADSICSGAGACDCGGVTQAGHFAGPLAALAQGQVFGKRPMMQAHAETLLSRRAGATH